MEDPILRARLRFQSMLASAEQAAQWAAEEPPGIVPSSTLMLAASKAMNRAGGFLEAISIVAPGLGVELLEEFESFALRVDSISRPHPAEGERRTAGVRRSRDERRAGDRRASPDRRRHSIVMAVERRGAADRRGEPDRRTGKIREVADRRWRAIQH